MHEEYLCYIYFILKLVCVQHTVMTEVCSLPAAMLRLEWFVLG